MMANTESIETVAQAILNYLSVHPNAADTEDGIHRWWIDWGAAGEEEESPDTTRLALQLLSDRGAMESVEIANRRVWHVRRDT